MSLNGCCGGLIQDLLAVTAVHMYVVKINEIEKKRTSSS